MFTLEFSFDKKDTFWNFYQWLSSHNCLAELELSYESMLKYLLQHIHGVGAGSAALIHSTSLCWTNQCKEGLSKGVENSFYEMKMGRKGFAVVSKSGLEIDRK